jgi:predicted MFS family arabinose efflux permease
MKSAARSTLGGRFFRLWTASGVSALGARVAREGLPLTAVLTLAASPAAVGVLAAATSAPAVLAGLLGGPFVDRRDRRRVMILADLARAALLAGVPLFALLHRLDLAVLLVVAAAVGAASVVFDMAAHAYLPSLVAPEALTQANAALEAADSVAEVAGPGLTGVLVSLLGAPLVVGLNVATYLASAAVLGGAPADAPRSPAATGERPADLWSGLRIAAAEPRVRPLLLMAAASSLFGGMFHALYIVFAVRALHLTPAMLGVTIMMGGVGSLAGAALAPRISRRMGLGRAILGASWLGAAFTALIPAAGGRPVQAMLVLMAAQVFGDAAGAAAQILQATARQTILPQETLGRTAGAFAAANGLALTLGAIGGGLLGEAVGLRPAMIVSAAGLLAAPAFALAPALLRYEGKPGGSA